ncbi:Myc-type basic helix-loop-helix (bHLH) domain-containing protein [Dioscorea alata]|uniref:Myc-type basic helix-loop-helix (BHLH) domain-containing protein n=1 Tax=Dioscorea alata TaxID=55571 RepID=A0ACB7TV45_DIOAL|nr:Myc-type basic helix-loop-helix (bHLH) domain-containing protein [Dioscorea alata]
MAESSSSWVNMENLRPPFQHSSTLLPSFSSTASSSSSSSLSSTSLPNSFLPFIPWFENQELSDSWGQLLLGGLLEEEDRCTFTSYQTKMRENWKNQLIWQPFMSPHETGLSSLSYHLHANEELHRTPWSTTTATSPILSTPSPKSCATSPSSNSMLDFSNSLQAERKVHKPDHSISECNIIITSNATFKKARTETSSSSSSAQSTFKVRKEKLGDRITALHQLVSPFGKTDTASVLLEAIGYIRFLQNQIEALSSPYLVTGPGNMKHHSGVHGEAKEDLRSRGLCLVPVSCTFHYESENGADYWAPSST